MDPFNYQWASYPPPLNQPPLQRNSMFYPSPCRPANAAEQQQFWHNFSVAEGAVSPSPSSSTSSYSPPSSVSPTPQEPSTLPKKQRSYNKWTDEQEKLLVQLWAEKYSKLESKDARKAWQVFVYFSFPNWFTTVGATSSRANKFRPEIL